MTAAEYTHPGRFPLTTLAGLTFDEQLALDRLRLARLLRLRGDGHLSAGGEVAQLAELEEKAAARPAEQVRPGEADGPR